MRSHHLAALESLVSTKSNANEVKVALTGLYSEVKDRLKGGRPSAVFLSSSVRAICRLRGVGHADIRIGCLADISTFFVTQGYPAEAVVATTEIAALAKSTQDKQWMRKAELLRGLISAELGSIAEAVICYSKAWQMALDLDSVPGQCAVLTNLGSALNYGALYREAIPCFQLGIRFSRMEECRQDLIRFGLPPSQTECALLNNLAQSYLYLGQFEEGFGAISDCLAKAPRPFNARTAISCIIHEFTFVQLAVELGKLPEAREHASACEEYARGRPRRAKQMAGICRGLCEVYSGDPDIGIELIESSLRIVQSANSIPIPTLFPLIKACEPAERPEIALKYMNVLLAHIKSAREEAFGVLISTCGQQHIVSQTTIGDDLHTIELTEARLRAKVAERKAIDARLEMLERLAVTADLKEEQSGEHGYRVGRLSSLVAERLEWRKDARNAIELAARLHDIGKIGVPDRILLNSQALRAFKRDLMSVHTLIGAELLAKSDIPQLRMAEDIARYHHEWWNGTGYAAKLSGKRIPIHARIVALADVFDALTHGRPYAPAWPIEKALEEIQQRRGTQFDPELTDRFIELVRRLQQEHADLDQYLGRAGRNSPFAQARNRIRLMLEEGRERVEKQVEASQTVH